MAWPDLSRSSTAVGPTFSKSRYLQGLQCSKLLWHVVNEPERVPSPDAGSLANFDQGRVVGNLARSLYPNGLLIDSLDRQVALSATVSAMSGRVPIFEAAFQEGACYTRVDVLVPVENDEWDVHEVKSSTSVEDLHLDDLAFQAHVLSEAGIKVRQLWLVLINNAYIHQGEIRPEQLFVRLNVTEQVQARINPIEKKLLNLLQEVAAPAAPTRSIGPHCNKPYPCPLQETCWAHLPPQNVTTLYRGAAKGFDFLAQGIVRLAGHQRC